MPFSIRDELSPVVQQYAMYLRNVRGLSSKTVTEYCKDLRTFFRFVVKTCARFSGLSNGIAAWCRRKRLLRKSPCRTRTWSLSAL